MSIERRKSLFPPIVGALGLVILSTVIQEKFLLAAALGGLFLVFSFYQPFPALVITLFAYGLLPDRLALALPLFLGITYLCRRFFFGEWDVRPTFKERIVYYYFILLIVSTIFSTDRGGSLRDLAIHSGGVLLFFLIVEEVNTKDRLYTALGILVTAGFLLTLYGLVQNFTGVEIKREWVDVAQNPDVRVRIFSVFGNPNVFAEYLEMIVPVTVGLFWAAKSEWKKTVFGAMAGAGLIAILLTMSRGGWLGIFAAAVFFLFFVEKRLFFWGIPVGAMIFTRLPDSIMRRLSSITNFADSSTSYRLGLYKITGEVISDYPVSGVGLGHQPFKKVFETYIRTMPTFHAHNSYLQTMAELGISGFIFFLLFLGSLFFYGIKSLVKGKDRELMVLGVGILSGIFGVFTHGFFENVLYLTKIILTFWTLVALLFATIRIEERG